MSCYRSHDSSDREREFICKHILVSVAAVYMSTSYFECHIYFLVNCVIYERKIYAFVFYLTITEHDCASVLVRTHNEIIYTQRLNFLK